MLKKFEFCSSQLWLMCFNWLEQLLKTENLSLRNSILAKSLESSLSSSGSNTYVKNNMAILALTGIILPYENRLSQLLGATTLDTFTNDFQKALNNPKIPSIILHIDSPGGAVTGVHECAEMIYQARGKKPIAAYISGLGASAAYWLASACDEIVLDATASVGSIGVLSIHTDDKAQKEKNGLVQTQIVSSQSPRKRVDITTEEGKADIQAQVDAIAEVFVAHVARNRRVSVETVLSDFGQGSLAVGRQAVTQGMADRLGSLEQLLQEKSEKPHRETKLFYPSPTGETSMTETLNPVASPLLTPEYLAAHHADVYESVMQRGAEQERERMQGVEAQCMPGHEALIQTLKFDGKTTGPEAAVQILVAERKRGDLMLFQHKAAAISPLPITQSIAEEPDFALEDAKPHLATRETWERQWQRSRALQDEFASFETYAAYMKAEQNGQIKIFHRS